MKLPGSGAGLETGQRFRLANFARAFSFFLLAIISDPSAFSASNLQEPIPSTPRRAVVVLDINGTRGLVYFDHKLHESYINPDSENPHKAQPGVACIGCHHTVTNVMDRSQFQNCTNCHKMEGDPSNPVDKEGYDLNSREIYHRSCIGCHRALMVKTSNERYQNSSFTRCEECHAQGAQYVAVPVRPEPQAPPRPPIPTTPIPAHEIFQTPMDPPLGFAGSSGIKRPEQTSPDFLPEPDRWRIGVPEDPRFKKGSALNPYGQNILKGDYPILGQHTFLNLTLESDSFANARRLPVPSDVSSQDPDRSEFFGNGDQYLPRQTFVVSADLFHGDTSYKPIDWRIKVTPAFQVNYLHTEENGIVNIDVRRGNTRTDHHTGLQEGFGELRLFSTDPYFDTTSVRVGIQPFVSDFRGFIFNDFNLGARLFGNFGNNRYQFNATYFDMLDKDTNSDLNTFNWRDQRVVIANFFRQDTKWKGYTTQFSYHYNQDDPGLHNSELIEFDDNNFLVRPAGIGIFTPHEIRAHYIGWAGDGHIGRLNISHAVYEVLGTDELNPIASRPIDLNAQMAAVEASVDKDWLRYKASFFWTSGDKDPDDGDGTGFDSILDFPEFAGGKFSFWNSQGIRLTQTGVALVNPDSLIPSLRSSKTEGQANFVNPGLFLYNIGLDADLTPKVKGVINLNYLRFQHTESLEEVLFQPDIGKEIGFDAGVGFLYRPALNENIILAVSVTGLIPGEGFKDIYTSNCSGEGCGADSKFLYSVLVRLKLTY
jgi:Class III cytochrome C family